MKVRSPKLTSIGWFAPGQIFGSHAAFFEKNKRLQTAPGPELELPELETHFIIIQGGRAEALAKEWAAKLNSIDWHAPGQFFFVFQVFGGVFFCLFLLITTSNRNRHTWSTGKNQGSGKIQGLGEICALLSAKQKLDRFTRSTLEQ